MGLNLEQHEESLLFIRGAVERQIFRPVDVYHDDQDNHDPAIIVACGDKDQAHDRLHHCWDRVTRQAQLVMVHGGGLLLDGLSPANREFNSVGFVLNEIHRGILAKEQHTGVRVKRIIPYFDFPCGVAGMYAITAAGSCRSAISVKPFLKQNFPGREVALKFYLDRPAKVLGTDHPLVIKNPNAKALTFNFSAKAMTEYLREFETSQSRVAVG